MTPIPLMPATALRLVGIVMWLFDMAARKYAVSARIRPQQANWTPRLNHCKSLSVKPAFAPIVTVVVGWVVVFVVSLGVFTERVRERESRLA